MKTLAVLALGVFGAIGFIHGCGTDNSGLQSSGDDGGAADATSGGDDATTGGGACGNGALDGTEECDQGAQNGAPGGSCQRDCTFTCVAGDATRGDKACDDGNACNGAETCQSDHSCKAGTPLGEGADCGGGKVCNGGQCVTSTCGDGIKESGEECDDGNATNGDGCDGDCKFSCVSNDPTRDCAPTDPCAGKGTCDDNAHTCSAGTPLGDGTACGAGNDAGIASDAAAGSVCKAGVCTGASCGDGVVDSPNEDCDFGAGNGAGTGCEIDCKFSCTKVPESCVTQDPCGGTNTCTTITFNDAGAMTGQKCVKGAPPPPNTACGNGGTCQGGICVTANCGNGVVDANEDCDWGKANNVAGSGCEPDCKFSCVKSPDSCPSSDPCSASPQKCATVTGGDGGNPGQKCQAATPVAACGACTSGAASGICVGNKCSAPKCGDACVTGTETCEPPNTATCDSQCHKIACGDGALEGTEQCDDKNTTNLDGCDSTCKFEQDHRANSVQLKFNTDAICSPNALGSAIASAAQGTVNSSLSTGVWDGSTTIAFKFMGLNDLSGTAQDAGLELGALSGAPYDAGKPYDGGADLDWWYATTASTYDSSRNPVSLLPASLAKKVLTAKGAVDISVILAGSLADLHMSSVTITANVGNASKPKTSSDGKSPGHLASEHVDPNLQTFETMSGSLCGNISSSSLSEVPMPASLLSGLSKCSEAYTASNHLLDAIVNGCHPLGGIVTAINPTQPDQIDPSKPAVGGGAPYTISATDGLTVDGCAGKDKVVHNKNSDAANFNACLAAAAYSSYFVFTTDRVIMK